MPNKKPDSKVVKWLKSAGGWCLRRVKPIIRRVVVERLLPLVEKEIAKGADKLYERIEERTLEVIDQL